MTTKWSCTTAGGHTFPDGGIDSLSRTVSYYRIPTRLLLSKASYLRTEAYSDAELSVHRPDLPFAFAQFADLEWPMKCPEGPEEFPNGSISVTKDESSEPRLAASRIFLEPFGPKGASKAGVLLEAANGAWFTEKELIWHAARLQSPFLRAAKVTTGIGIYRSGIRRKLPSYYIWGAKSRMET